MTRFRKLLKIISNVLFGVTIGLLVIVALLITMSNSSGNGRQMFGGFGFARVATGSMEPVLPTGCFILIEQVDSEALLEGDTITFWSDDPKVPEGFPVSHRIERIEQNGSERIFITKGAANTIEDPYPVYDDDIIGKVVWHSVALGAIIAFAQSPYVLPILIGVLVVCMVINIVSVVREAQKLSDESNKAAVAAAREETLRQLHEGDPAQQPQSEDPN